MATEGQWVKSDGDIFFASDANRLYRGGTTLFLGSTATLGSTVTGFNIAGSVLIPAGSLSNPAWLDLNYCTVGNGATAMIVISGQSGNFRVSGLANANKSTTMNVVVGSPGSGHFQAIEPPAAYGDPALAMFGQVSNFNPNAAFVVFFAIRGFGGADAQYGISIIKGGGILGT